MPVSRFVPSRVPVRHRVQPSAVSRMLRFDPARSGASTVTTDRTRRVGGPTPLLVLEAASTGFEGLEVVERRAIEAARELRRQGVAAGRSGLTDVVQGLDALVKLAASAAASLGEDLAFFEEEELHASERTRAVVNELIRGEQSGDAAALAQILEQRLVPTLAVWRAVFESMAGLSDPGPFGDAA